MKTIMVLGVAGLAGLAISAPTAAQDSAFLAANLLGQEVPGGGDDKASGNFNGEVDLKRNRVCYYLDMDGLGSATSVHIHQKDQAGTDTPTLPMQVPGAGGKEVCVTGESAVLAEIAKKPEEYYIDVHTSDHPEGAVRGTLKE